MRDDAIDHVRLTVRALAIVAGVAVLGGCTSHPDRSADGPPKVSAASIAAEAPWTPATSGPLAAAGPLRAHLDDANRVVCDDATYGRGLLGGTGVTVVHHGEKPLSVTVIGRAGSHEKGLVEPSLSIVFIEFHTPVELVRKVIMEVDSERPGGACEVPKER